MSLLYTETDQKGKILVNMPDPIQKRFGHGAKIRPDCICRIQLPASDSVLFFQTRPRSQLLCKTDLDPILMAWSRFGQTHLVQKQVSVQESLGLVLAECKRPTTSFPLSDSVVFFHRWPRSYCAKPAQI